MVEVVLLFVGIPVAVVLVTFGFVYAPGPPPDAATPRYVAWLNPFRVALLGAVVVALLLVLPISIRRPGDHESMSCGNALHLDLGQPRDYAGERDAWARAHRACTTGRITRVAQSVGAVSATLLVITAVSARTRRRRLTDGDAA
ncbi:MAG TPA: hypothetical protein VES42_13445 [Pilimelia sp.]|nr:hypothetical protein [Pilimelia sp.]